jgi:serine phosphatase RsbU (regulator of sigma subunit)
MRQGLALVRGALIATALLAVPVAAHAVTVPGASVDAGPVHVQTPPVTVTPPATHTPVDPVVHGVDGTVNNVTSHAPTHVQVPPPIGGNNSGSSAQPASNGGNGGGGPPSSHSTTPPGRGGGGTGANRGRTPKARKQARARAAARKRRATGRNRRAAANRKRHRAATLRAKRAAHKSKSDGGSSNPFASALSSIEQVVPGPVLALIGILALLAAAFALRSSLISRRARRLERQRQELLGDVGLLQRALLPDVPGDLSGIDVSVAYRPAEGPAAGGDFYDVFDLGGDRTAIIVGDVCGHGRQALAVTALMRYTLRAYLGAGFEPRVALQVAGRTIEGAPDSELTTVVLAVYDAKAGTLTYACAGHEPPIVLGPSAHEPVTVSSAPPLGGFMATGQRQTTVPLAPGAAACFFTDGLVEARLGDQMIGRERLTELVTELAPDEGAQLLLDRLAAAADRAPDDMAACLVRARDEAVGSFAARIEELEADAEELEDGERVLQFLTACRIPEKAAQEMLRRAQVKASEFGSALLRVHTGKRGRVEILPAQVAALPVPSLAADARRRAAELKIPA